MGVTSEKIKLENVRLSFAELFVAKPFKPGEEKKRYQATYLLDPSDKAHAKQIKMIEAAGEAIGNEEWDGKIPKLKGRAYGYEDDLEGKIYDGYEGMFWVKTSKGEEEGRVTVVDQNNDPLTADDNKVYNGCYVDATLTLWTQDNSWGKRINGNLRAIKYRGPGEAFGRAPIEAEDEFGESSSDDGGFLDD